MVMYNISLSNANEVNNDTLDKVKLVAYLLYDALIDYEYDNDKNVLYKDNIVINEVYDSYNLVSKYEFEHTDYNTGIYEPFMINDTSFGFTVNDGSISNQEIINMIKEVKAMVNFDGDFTVSSISLKNKQDRLTKISSFYPKAKTRIKKMKIAGILL